MVAVLLTGCALRTECRAFGVRVDRAGAWRERSVLFNFSMPALLSSVAVSYCTWLATVVLARQAGGYQQLGIYSAAAHWRALLVFVPNAFLQVALPVVTTEQGGGRADRVTDVTQSLCLLLTFPLATLVMFLAQPLTALYGHSFQQSADILIAVSCTVMISSVGGVSGPLLQAQGRMWFANTINWSWGVIFVVLSWLLCPRYGALGLSYAQAVAYLITSVWMFAKLAPSLPPGMMRRMYASLGLACVMPLMAAQTGASVRLVLAGPISVAVLCIVIQWLTPDRLFTQLKIQARPVYVTSGEAGT